MRKLGLLLLILVFLTGTVSAADMGQVTCNANTATKVGPSSTVNQFFRVWTIQNQTPSVGVYIGPLSTITAATGGILLSTTTGIAYVAENTGETWYCITASSTATVGYTRR